MATTKKDVLAQLQKEILPLQGCKPIVYGNALENGLGIINHAFPNATFPLGAVHEFISEGAEDNAATGGFIGGILGPLMLNGGAAIWISGSKTIFPPALQSFGIAPDRIIFIVLHKEKEMLWAMQEALKCEGLAAVIGEIPDISFTASRRLQLAVEQSQVTGFVLRCNPRNLNNTACVTRWKITHLPTDLPAGMPGVGFPRWNVELLKVRNGKPGSWQLEFVAGRFRQVSRLTVLRHDQQKKFG